MKRHIKTALLGIALFSTMAASASAQFPGLNRIPGIQGIGNGINLSQQRTSDVFEGVWKHFLTEPEKFAGRDAWDLGAYFDSKNDSREKVAKLYRHALENRSDEFSPKELKLHHYNAACIALRIRGTKDQQKEWTTFARKHLGLSLDAIEDELAPLQPGTSEHDRAHNAVIEFLAHWKEDPDLEALGQIPNSDRENDTNSTNELWSRHKSLLEKLRKTMMEAGKK